MKNIKTIRILESKLSDLKYNLKLSIKDNDQEKITFFQEKILELETEIANTSID